jgi:adenylate cyclase
LLTGDTLTRPDYAAPAELALLLFLGLVLAFVLPRCPAVIAAIIGVLVVAALFGTGWSAYRYAGLLFDPIYPAGTLCLQIAGTALHSYRTAEGKRTQVQRIFSQYVSPRVAQYLTDHPDKVALGGEERELTLIFTDVRNFTTLAEGLSAAELTRLLNEMLTPLTDLIFQCGNGTLDKYMGDGIMAFWNAPLDDARHAQHACDAALAMQRKMRELNAFWRHRAEQDGIRYRPVDIGVGVNTGVCCVGNLGSSQHYDYSAIGDNVNVTSRLESLTRFYNVPAIIGEDTRKLVQSHTFLELDILRVKGRSGATRIFTLMDLLDIPEDVREPLEDIHERLLAAYREGRCEQAQRALAACRAYGVNGLESLYRIYEDRIAKLSAGPIPEGWDGIYTAYEK